MKNMCGINRYRPPLGCGNITPPFPGRWPGLRNDAPLALRPNGPHIPQPSPAGGVGGAEHSGGPTARDKTTEAIGVMDRGLSAKVRRRYATQETDWGPVAWVKTHNLRKVAPRLLKTPAGAFAVALATIRR